MIFCRACPKCNGDVSVCHDVYGAFVQCLQCGLLRDVGHGYGPYGVNTRIQVSKLLEDHLRYAKAQA